MGVPLPPRPRVINLGMIQPITIWSSMAHLLFFNFHILTACVIRRGEAVADPEGRGGAAALSAKHDKSLLCAFLRNEFSLFGTIFRVYYTLHYFL